MNQNVVNFFDQYFISDLLIQGLLLSIFIVIGFIFLFRDFKLLLRALGLRKEVREIKKATRRVFTGIGNMLTIFISKKELNGRKGGEPSIGRRTISQVYNIIPVLCLCLSILIISGVIGNRIGDTLMDQDNLHHLGMKHFWLEIESIERSIIRWDKNDSDSCDRKDCYHRVTQRDFSYARERFGDLSDTDGLLKAQVFDDIFPEHSHLCIHKKMEFYYETKQAILANTKWNGFLFVTQRLINYSQVLVFCFLLLIILLYFDLWMVAVISFNKITRRLGPKDRKLRRILNRINALLFPLIFGGYVVLIALYQESPWIAYGHYLFLSFYAAYFYVLFRLSLRLRRQQVTTMINYRLLTLFFCLLLYSGVSIAWRENEREFNFKVFDIYKISNGKQKVILGFNDLGRNPTIREDV